ncbi:hypothetical protein Brms1b_009523 [Colletotrichum noveboracense]|nr:hypothetical protein Brms1b_009523 [Colletotrichum noveboracense]
MSFVTRRGLSTLIPPKVASPKALGADPNAVRMQRVVNFYEKLPRGPAPEAKASGILGRYAAKHFNGKNASAKRMLRPPPRRRMCEETVLTGRAQPSSTPSASSSSSATPRTTTSTSVSFRPCVFLGSLRARGSSDEKRYEV